MLVQDLINSIRLRLAQTDPDNSSWGDDALIQYINDARRTISQRVPWRTSRAIIGTGVSNYPLPATCTTIESIEGLASDYIPGSMSDMRFESSTIATPRNFGKVYAVQNRYVWFAPALSETLTLRYRGFPDAVTDTTDTLDAPETLYDAYVFRVIADCLDDIDSPKADKYEEKYEKAVTLAESLEASTQMPLQTSVRYAVPG